MLNSTMSAADLISMTITTSLTAIDGPFFQFMYFTLNRTKDQDSNRLDMQRFEETMETLKTELKKEQDKNARKNSRDIAEVRILAIYILE